MNIELRLFTKLLLYAIPCPFFVGRVKRQRNPTLMLGYGYGSYVATQAIATLRERTSTQPTNQDFFRFGQGIVLGYIIHLK